MNELIPIMSESAIVILSALLSLLAAYTVRWVNTATAKARAETARIEDDQFRDFANEALARVDDLTTKTVTQIEQTTAKVLRELVKDGAVEKEALAALGVRAVDEIIYSLSPAYRDAISQTVGGLREYVTKAVEAKVYELKHGFLPAATIELVE